MTKNEKGFTAVEAVIIIVVVALLAAVGWYVYRMNNKDDKKTTSTTSQKASADKKDETKPETKPAADTKTYVTIKEWNVRAEYNGDQKLVYKMTEYGNAGFSSEALEKYGKACSAQNMASGYIQRLKPTDGTDIDGKGLTAQEAARTNDKIVKVGDYYYRYVGPQSTCTEPNDTTIKLQETTNEAVSGLVPKLTVVQ